MSELTGQEISRACEAVGWEWNGIDPGIAAATALLKAAVVTFDDVDGYEHLSCPAGELVRLVKWDEGSPDLDDDEAGSSCTVKAWASGPDFPTAAVRAINAASAARDEEG